MTATMIITAVLISAGLLFMLASLVGIAVLPDFFTRLHAQGVGDTLGAFLILAGMMTAVHGGLMSVKILLIFIVIVLTNPIGTNLMMIAAINKEDYLGYRSRMSGESHESAEPEPETIPETEPEPIPEEKPAVEEKPVAEEKPEPEKKPADEEKPAEEKKPEEKNRKKKEKKEAGKPADKTDGAEKKAPKKKRRRKPSMSMNKSELIKAAENRGIKVPEGATKRDILDLIYAGREKKAGE